MFALGIFLIFGGYAFTYAGVANFLNNGHGPSLTEALGFKLTLAPPGADKQPQNLPYTQENRDKMHREPGPIVAA